ncbi:MAG: poly-beta-1,6 N-acetyl-D-glucosamine synthase [Deltaproteobacteria bacterium]|nr:poly-beta-1,6 N-acetyl-D-glucosamine synthase [Deltaproteobacteria bacterium]
MEWLFNFVFFYPLLMSFVWIAGACIFIIFRMDRQKKPPKIEGNPLVSILIPCHNEEASINETINAAMQQEYPNYEVIAINDASTDRTAVLLTILQQQYPRLRVVTLATNQGKAVGLTMAAIASRGEYLVCIDADALLDPQALPWLLSHFAGPRVGAVTGNPRVRNRTTIIAKIQVAEFSSIIGMIKRAQRVIGKVFTVSGVVVAFRKRALLDVGFWSNNMVTEDIDISWKLQLAKWDIRYEPRALCWILMPEMLRGLWRQRLRWAQGGIEVLLKYGKDMFRWHNRRIWPIYTEYVLSLCWCYSFLVTLLLWLAGFFINLPQSIIVRTMIPGWTGIIIATVCLVQLTVGIGIDRRYDKHLSKLSIWLLWYPAIYWVINCFVTIAAFPKALFKNRQKSAVWTSPDRGFGR